MNIHQERVNLLIRRRKWQPSRELSNELLKFHSAGGSKWSFYLNTTYYSNKPSLYLSDVLLMFLLDRIYPRVQIKLMTNFSATPKKWHAERR